MIRFFNTLSGKLEEFRPLHNHEVRMYTCGPTVYDYAHIGNFRAFIFEDLLRRFLEFKGFSVKHVMNITDVDDKTIAGARREGKALDDFTGGYVQAFLEDLTTLNILRAAELPRATRWIPKMVALVEELIQKGIAYVNDGSVYYRVSAFPTYGKLSKKKLEKNISGARVDVDEYDKEEGSDFALWKKAKGGERAWNSPWGEGRPGWHVECSAMSMEYLGETFDIHAGGEDLIFPHHENEIAQSEAATGKPFVRYWLHCKHLLVNGEKMSKTKENYYTLRDLVGKGYDPMAIRYALLSVHYRAQLNFTLEGLKEAAEVIRRLDDCYAQCVSLNTNLRVMLGSPLLNPNLDLKSKLNHVRRAVESAFEDDLNVSKALANVFEGVRVINRAISENLTEPRNVQPSVDFFKFVDQLFGFDIAAYDSIPSQIVNLVIERWKIRNDANFMRDKSLQEVSDRLRDQIQDAGVLVKDGKPGEASTVKRKRRAWDQP